MERTQTDQSRELIRAYHNVLRLEETKRKHSRTTTSFRGRNAMEFIYNQAPDGKGSRTQSEIADYLRITRPSCTVLLDKLEKLDYIRRRKSSADERTTLVELTRKGRLVTTYQTAHRDRVLADILSEFTPEEQEVLFRGFSRMNEVFETCIQALEANDKKSRPESDSRE